MYWKYRRLVDYPERYRKKIIIYYCHRWFLLDITVHTFLASADYASSLSSQFDNEWY
jgi:hypothetical protein